MKWLFVVGVVALTSSLSVEVRRAEGGLLSGDDLKSLLPGATMYTINKRSGRDVVVTYGVDGSYFVRVPEITWSDDGKWWVSGDEYCFECIQASGCARSYHNGGDRYLFEDDRGEGLKATIKM